MRIIALALLLVTLSLDASAQRSNFTKYLIPIDTQEAPGANGSLWRTEWIVHNAGPETAVMSWNRCFPHSLLCTEQYVPPRTTVRPHILSRAFSEGSQGAYVYIHEKHDPFVGMTLRVRDLSQNAQSFGTELPIVSESEFRTSIHLLDVPTDPKYRATLRIYGPNETTIPVQVTVMAEGTQVEQYTVQLEGVVFIQEPEFPLFPAYGELDPLTPAVRSSGGRVHVVVESQAPIWAFVTVTNNETQQVTTVTSK